MILSTRVNSVLRLLGARIVRTDFVPWGTQAMPYGVSLPHDLRRLSADRPIRLVFDVGANRGQFALSVLNSFPDAHVWSFEPFPETFEQLQLALSDHPRLRTFRLGCGAQDGAARMTAYDCDQMNTCADHPMYLDYFRAATLRTTGSCEIELRSLDSFCDEMCVRHIDLLKIDTEGFDLEVLKGATELMRSGCIRFILTEYYRPTPSPDTTQGALSELASYLAAWNFEFVTSYTEHIDPAKRYFGAHNALFAYAPDT
jgi:FkbM family methyltransferase